MKKKLLITLPLLILLILFITPTVLAALSRTQTIWSETGSGGVDVTPYVRIDKNALFVDFEAANFDNINYVYYNLNYDTDEDKTIRGVEGHFFPRTTEITGYYNNKPYFRKELLLGTCSKGVCNYHTNPKNMQLTVKTHYFSGKVLEHTKVLAIPDDQL